MSNYIEYKERIAFHPGYYIKEIVDESGLTQEDFAKRLDTTPKNLSILIRGEQKLSTDIAMKLSRMLGTSVEYWLNLQKSFDAVCAQIKSDKELESEKEVFKYFDYYSFRKKFGLPRLDGNVDGQIEAVRRFLNISTLSVLKKRDMAVDFREEDELTEESIIKANTITQVAVNKALKLNVPKYNAYKLKTAAKKNLSIIKEGGDVSGQIYNNLLESGVIFMVFPLLPDLKIQGVTKKIKNKVLLMTGDDKLSSFNSQVDFLRELWNIIDGDFGISFRRSEEDYKKLMMTYAERIKNL